MEPEGRTTLEVPTYVVDTHALYWYLQDPDRLSVAADAIFRLAEAGQAYVVVPAIVVAEIFYLTRKQGRVLTPSELLADLEEAQGFLLSDLGRAQLEQLELLDVPEMHDRLIAAHAVVHGSPVVTKDPAIHSLSGVEAVW